MDCQVPVVTQWNYQITLGTVFVNMWQGSKDSLIFAFGLQVEVDVVSDTDEWQTWPGYLILTFRVLVMMWFLWEMRETFLLERVPEKHRFYLHFGAGFLVWFVYLPILALICSQISALWRYKTILSKYSVHTHQQ